MIDGRLDADLESSRRARTQEEFARNAAWRQERGVTLGRPRGILSAEAAAARREQMRTEAGEGNLSTVEEVPPPAPHPPVDAEAAYRRGRLGIVAALVLVLLFVWIRQLRVSRS